LEKLQNESEVILKSFYVQSYIHKTGTRIFLQIFFKIISELR